MTDQTQPVEETGSDVRSDVLAAFEKHGVSTEQDWSIGDKPADVPETPVETTEEQKARARDEQGRFAKSAAPKDVADVKEVPGLDKPEEKPAQVSTPDGPPIGWPADAKAAWNQLSPAIQAAVVKREQEISNGGRQWSEEKRRYEETLNPVREVSKRYGVDEKEGIQRLLTANEFLERDPANALRYLANLYRVDLKQLADAPRQAAPRVDSAVQALYQEIHQLKQTLTSREQEEIQTEIQTFAKDKPHFSDVRQYMGRLLESGAAESMQDAYEQAIWAIPAVREKMQAEREGQAKAERERVERVEKAKRGAVSLKGSPSSTPSIKPKEHATVRDAVMAAWNEHASH